MIERLCYLYFYIHLFSFNKVPNFIKPFIVALTAPFSPFFNPDEVLLKVKRFDVEFPFVFLVFSYCRIRFYYLLLFSELSQVYNQWTKLKLVNIAIRSMC